MIAGTGNTYLSGAGLVTRSQRVFYQRWLELLHHRTMSTYSVRLLNPHGVLSEYLEVLDSSLQQEINKHHVPPVWAEARKKVFDCRVLADKAPAVRSALVRQLSSCPKLERASLLRARLEVEPLLERLDRYYLDWVLECLTDAFQRDDYSAAEDLAGYLASEMLLRRHPYTLYTLAVAVFLHGNGDFDERWRSFISVIRRPARPMQVYLPLSTSAPWLGEYSARLGFSVISREDAMQRPSLEEFKERIHHGLVVIERTAEDILTAASEAKDVFAEALDTLSIFYNVPDAIVANWAIVEYSSNGRTKAKEAKFRPEPNVFWPDIDITLDRVLDVMGRESLDEDSRQRIRSTIQYSRLGAASHSASTRYLNRWVALEAFMRQGGSILDDLKRYVPPLLSNRYIFLLLRNFLDDCGRCGINLSEANVAITTTTQDHRVRDLFHAMLDPQRKQALFDLCQSHDLLHLRATLLADCLQTGKSVSTLMSAHRQNVEWNIQRLYRIRNMIVHSGKSHGLVSRCTKHLDEYVHRVFVESLHKMVRHGIKSVPEAIVMMFHNYETTIENLDAIAQQDVELTISGALL